jgi:putative FmdB family regulatory protein
MPLYEYVCRSCGTRSEQMRKVSERLVAPACPACGLPATLAMSAPGRVGAGGGVSEGPAWGGSCAPGGCCGGGACGHGSA